MAITRRASFRSELSDSTAKVFAEICFCLKVAGSVGLRGGVEKNIKEVMIGVFTME